MPTRFIQRRAALAPNDVSMPHANAVFVDSDDDQLKFTTGTSGTTTVDIVTESQTQTLTNKTLTSPVVGGDLGLNDDISLELGTDDDSVLRHVAAANVANTALTDVLVGTPVTQATAANSLMVSNVTASGDILVAANRGGNSEEYFFADASAGNLTLTGPGTSITLEAGTTVVGIVNATSVELEDGIILALGNDQDCVAVQTAAGVAADTALTGVLIGTPVTDATAANSLIIANATASGDILVAANRGGNSEEYLFADASAGALYLSGLAGGISLALATDQPAPDLAGEAVHIWDGTAGAITATTDSRLIIESNDATANYLQFLSPNAATQGILFGDVDDADIGSIKYNHTGNTFEFTKGTAAVNIPDIGGVVSGLLVGATITYTEDATSTTHTGTVEIPANATLNNIVCNMGVLWAPTGTASFNVGDDDDADGWFAALDMKATDWLVGEVLDITNAENWGGKNGVYLVAATGRKGQAIAAYSGTHTTAVTEVIGVATIGTPAATAGRSYMTVSYLAPTAVAATVA